ncbi:iron chaperone [Terrabacter sp. BE26]|uniref:iron chaperone n=1 Tax=Terrabacter sp. BE26 TaxID=2898152 RepID=UPI0035BE4618
MGTIGDYLAGLPAEQREALQHVVDVAARVAPDAVEGTSYGMPALRLDRHPLIGVRAAAGHLSVYPFSPAVVEAVAADLDGFSTSKGTIRFAPGHLLPDEVVERLVRLRRAEVEGDER